MIYLGIFYEDNGKVIVQEFYTYNAMKQYIATNIDKYWTYDIYTAKCINNRILTLFKN